MNNSSLSSTARPSPLQGMFSKKAADVYFFIVTNDFIHDPNRIDRIVTIAFNLAIFTLFTLALFSLFIIAGAFYAVHSLNK